MLQALARLVPILSLLAVLAAGPARAEDIGPQAKAVIQSQLDAFERGDAPGAYAMASPAIKSLFVDSGIFMEMARTKYARLSIITGAPNSAPSRSTATTPLKN